jgi:signal transduction histidine kinase
LRDEPFDGFEMAFAHPAAGARNLIVNGRTLLREQGKPRMVLLSMEDITDRKRAHEILTDQSRVLERAVRERTAELQATTEEMEIFSYTVSHDLRAPLRAMRGYAEALLQDLGARADETSQGYMRKIIQSGDRMDRLILDVLTYSRTAHAEVNVHPVDLDALVKDVIKLNPDLQAPGASVEIAGPLAPVLGDASALVQCLANILLNAVKFMDPGKRPEIRIRTETSGGEVRLWIEDNGIGIAPEQHERIFGMFEKLDIGRVFPGTGIGLAIVKKSMERMGGKSGVDSELGRGSRFWLQLPQGAAV